MGLGWCKGWPQEVSSHREFNPRDRSRSRFVVSVAGGNGNGWFKNLLLSKIEIPDVDLGGFDDDDEDMNGDGDGDEGVVYGESREQGVIAVVRSECASAALGHQPRSPARARRRAEDNALRTFS